ncbi:MAG: hypothetical protein ACKVTZ_19120 [Bacteroidia bacterium]
MHKFGIISLLFLLILQSCAPKWDPRKYRAVKITDSELIYSTYDLNKKEHEKDKLILTKKRKLPDSLFKKITTGYNETRWPPALQTPQLRYDNRRKLKFYKAYIITEFKNKYIVYVPNKENKGSIVLPPEMMSDKDFYMIVGKGNVEKQDEFMKGYENWTPPVKGKKEEAIAAAPTRPTKLTPNSDLKALDKGGSKPNKPAVKPETPPSPQPSKVAPAPIAAKTDKSADKAAAKAQKAADKAAKSAEKANKKAEIAAKKEAEKQAAAAEKASEAEKDKQLGIKKGKNSKETRKRIKSERKKKSKSRKKERKQRKKAREKAKKEKEKLKKQKK